MIAVEIRKFVTTGTIVILAGLATILPVRLLGTAGVPVSWSVMLAAVGRVKRLLRDLGLAP